MEEIVKGLIIALTTALGLVLPLITLVNRQQEARIKEKTAEIAALKADASNQGKRIKELEDKTGRVDDMERQLKALTTALEGTQEELRDTRARLTKAEEGLENEQKRNNDLTAENSRLRDERDQANAHCTELEIRLREAHQNIALLGADFRANKAETIEPEAGEDKPHTETARDAGESEA